MEESITVSIPYYGCPETIERAVSSVLNQTHKNLIVVVVVDGDEIPSLPEDDRLIVYRLPENRGRYFADAVVLGACNTDWFTVHDADDWSEPDRYANMLRQNARRQNPVIASAETVHNGVQTFKLLRSKSRPGHMDHLWHMSALYRTSFLRGLMHPEFRVGYDTLLCNILQLNTDITYSVQPQYHRVVRSNSLMNNDVTGMKSVFRQQQTTKLRVLFGEVKKLSKHQESLALIRDMIAADCSSETLKALKLHIHELQQLLPLPITAGDASNVVLTTLTGGRPDLLAETITSLMNLYPEILIDAEWIVCVNGNDPESLDILSHYEHLIDKMIINNEVVSIGNNMSLLANEAYCAGRSYWLHLEDDWVAGPSSRWLEAAKTILREHPSVSQVRLRQSWEKTLNKNMVNGRPIRWQQLPKCRFAQAHLTFNPFLMRTEDIQYAWPSINEMEAQRKWHAAGKTRVAQLTPGVWSHIGHKNSFRTTKGSA